MNLFFHFIVLILGASHAVESGKIAFEECIGKDNSLQVYDGVNSTNVGINLDKFCCKDYLGHFHFGVYLQNQRCCEGAYKPIYNQEAFECIPVADGEIVKRKVVPKMKMQLWEKERSDTSNVKCKDQLNQTNLIGDTVSCMTNGKQLIVGGIWLQTHIDVELLIPYYFKRTEPVVWKKRKCIIKGQIIVPLNEAPNRQAQVATNIELRLKSTRKRHCTKKFNNKKRLYYLVSSREFLTVKVMTSKTDPVKPTMINSMTHLKSNYLVEKLFS